MTKRIDEKKRCSECGVAPVTHLGPFGSSFESTLRCRDCGAEVCSDECANRHDEKKHPEALAAQRARADE